MIAFRFGLGTGLLFFGITEWFDFSDAALGGKSTSMSTDTTGLDMTNVIAAVLAAVLAAISLGHKRAQPRHEKRLKMRGVIFWMRWIFA
jgi:hypothetical protein